MLIIFGIHQENRKPPVSERQLASKHELHVTRNWLSVFFIPLIPFSYDYWYKDGVKIREVSVPILPVALCANLFFFLGVLMAGGIVPWLGFLVAWFVSLMAFVETSEHFLTISSIFFLVGSMVYVWRVYDERKKMQKKFERELN